jgi:acetyltransferase-like isoleucine patch superfamily enzyme
MGYLSFSKWLQHTRSRIFTSLIRPDFGSIGKDTIIHTPFHSNYAKEIYIGDNCVMFGSGWLDTIPEYAGVKFSPRLEIGDGTYMGFRVHISVCSSVTIGKNVVMADSVYITDSLHGYQDVNAPVMPQPLVLPGPVTIEDEVWLGQAVCVMPNVTIGRHSVVGSNSVVTKDIPPYSVAVGCPAKVIRQYNHELGKWEKVG